MFILCISLLQGRSNPNFRDAAHVAQCALSHKSNSDSPKILIKLPDVSLHNVTGGRIAFTVPVVFLVYLAPRARTLGLVQEVVAVPGAHGLGRHPVAVLLAAVHLAGRRFEMRYLP